MPTRPAPMSAQPRRSAASARRRARRRRSMSARSGGTLVRAHANAGVVLSGIAGRRALLDQGLDLGLLVTAVAAQRADAGQLPGLHPAKRKSRFSGKGVSVRVDTGGRRIIIKKKNNTFTSIN